MAEYISGVRNNAIYLQAKTGLNNGATPERVAGIYRRDFSAKQKLPFYFARNNKAWRYELNQMVIDKIKKKKIDGERRTD